MMYVRLEFTHCSELRRGLIAAVSIPTEKKSVVSRVQLLVLFTHDRFVGLSLREKAPKKKKKGEGYTNTPTI